MKPTALARVLCTLLPEGSAPPTEFRIFKAGANPTTKGVFIFDAAAAAAVMASYTAQGVRHMIDLNHESLEPATREDSGDARGWYDLELRNGELWAVNVTWTPDGARRLAEKRQRYISPAFCTDDEKRVTEMINCALVAMPATHDAQPLAASRLRANASRVTADKSVAARAAGYVLLEQIKRCHPIKSKPQSKR